MDNAQITKRAELAADWARAKRAEMTEVEPELLAGYQKLEAIAWAEQVWAVWATVAAAHTRSIERGMSNADALDAVDSYLTRQIIEFDIPASTSAWSNVYDALRLKALKAVQREITW